MITTYACLVTDENVDQIVADAAKWGLAVAHVKDEYQDEYAESGVNIYAILSVNYKTREAAFTTAWSEDFNSHWIETGATHGNIWYVVKLKEERR